MALNYRDEIRKFLMDSDTMKNFLSSVNKNFGTQTENKNETSGDLTGGLAGGIKDSISEKLPQAGSPSVSTGYVESDSVKAAKKALNNLQKPGAYQSQWQTSLDEAMNKILNREKFNYDLNGDALYQQYKDQYINQGRQAMMDAIGKSSALTGGYGNSWAQSAGQQTFHGYLNELNDRIPELYQLALDRYNMEGDKLMDEFALYLQREGIDYDRYRDQMSDYLSERGYLSDRYDSERNYDYGKFADDRDFSYQTERDKIADEQWEKEFDEARRQFLAANPEAAMYYNLYGGNTGSGAVIGGTSTGNSYLDMMLGMGGSGSSGGFNGIQLYPTGGSSSSRKSSGSKIVLDGKGGSSDYDGGSSDSDVVDEIIRGDWGNGQNRKDALKAAGYSDSEIKQIQAEVNKRMEGVTGKGKSLFETLEKEIKTMTKDEKAEGIEDVEQLYKSGQIDENEYYGLMLRLRGFD